MKFGFFKNSKLGIAIKTAIAAGIVTFLLLVANGGVFLALESRLVDLIFGEYKQKISDTIDQLGENRRKELEENMITHAKVIGNASATFLYNLDKVSMERMLGAYIKLPELAAVVVYDEQGEPFFAIWKDPKINMKRNLPDNFDVSKFMSSGSDAFVKEEKVGSVKIYVTTSVLMAELVKKKEGAEAAIARFENTVNQKKEQAKYFQIAIIFIVILVLLGFIVLTMNIIAIKPLKVLIAMVEDLVTGDGDLTKRLTVNTKDEIGLLADWFNRFIEQMQGLVREIASNSETLNLSSSNMSQVAEQLSTGSDSLSGQSRTVSKAADQMSNNMTSVAEASEEASSNVNVVASATEEMNATVGEIAQNSEKARSVTDEAVKNARNVSRQVEELGAAANDISNVTEVINDISEQTNLLALNATIEAARAGEAGKGFSVVANEIKELAKQTADATKDIKSKVEGIQGSTASTVKEIEQISQVIFDVNEIVSTIATAVEEQSVTTREIANNISQAARGIDSVSTNVSQSSEVASEIAQSIAEIDQATEMMSQNSTDVKESANSLLMLAEQLNTMVSRYKI